MPHRYLSVTTAYASGQRSGRCLNGDRLLELKQRKPNNYNDLTFICTKSDLFVQTA